MNISGVGNSKLNVSKKISVGISSVVTDYSANIEVFITKKITSLQPGVSINFNNWSIPGDIRLADPEFNKSSTIDMLVGAELFLELMTNGNIYLEKSLPRLQNTVFGWVVSGKIQREPQNKLFCGVHTLESMVTKFWEMEEPPRSHQPMTRA